MDSECVADGNPMPKLGFSQFKSFDVYICYTFVVDYHAEVYAAWKLGEFFNSLGLSEENVLNLEKAANSSILEILKHDAFVHSLGRVTKFLRTTPQAQLMARDALIANRLKDTVNGKKKLFLSFFAF